MRETRLMPPYGLVNARDIILPILFCALQPSLLDSGDQLICMGDNDGCAIFCIILILFPSVETDQTAHLSLGMRRTSGVLRTFGNLLASLTPFDTCDIVWTWVTNPTHSRPIWPIQLWSLRATGAPERWSTNRFVPIWRVFLCLYKCVFKFKCIVLACIGAVKLDM